MTPKEKRAWRKSVINSIHEVTEEPMSRLEAWNAVTATGVDVSWEMFKRFWSDENLKKKKKKELIL